MIQIFVGDPVALIRELSGRKRRITGPLIGDVKGNEKGNAESSVAGLV